MAEDHEKREDANLSQLLNLLSAVANLLVYLIILLWWFSEFILNPNHNISTYLRVEHNYTMGVVCEDEGYVRWSVKILKIVRNGKVTTADALLRRIDQDGNQVDPQDIILYEKQHLKFPCTSGEVEGPLMWDMSPENGIQVRHPPSFEIGELGSGP